MLLESHLRLTMSVLCCFSIDILRPTGAALTMEWSITTKQCPGCRLQILQIFLHTSDSHLCLNFFSDQPNDAEVDMARQRGCTLVASLITLHSCRSIRAILVQQKNIAIGKFSYGTLLFNYSCILLKGMEQNIHLDLLFKILCMKTRPSALVAE